MSKPASLSYPRLSIIVACRLLLNALFRVAYPLIPFIATRFGVSLEAASWLVTAQVLAALLSPIGGWLGDRQGYRRTMQLGLILSALGALAIAFAPTFAAVIAAAVVLGLGLAIYQPSMQAFVSDHVPLARRGRALGIVELSWSLSGIVAVPLLVHMIAWNGDIRLPFTLLAGLVVVLLVLGIFHLPADYPRPTYTTARPRFHEVLLRPSVAFLLLFMWLSLVGEEVLFIAQVPWLIDQFAATPQSISNALFFFGIGELIGVLLVTAFADRLGKVRAPILGYSAAVVVYLLLPVFGRTWESYLLLFMLFAVAFEFGIVASFPLASSVEPEARGMVLSATTIATNTGRAAGSRIGVALYGLSGLMVNGIVSAVVTLVGIGLVAKYVRPHETEHTLEVSRPVTEL